MKLENIFKEIFKGLKIEDTNECEEYRIYLLDTKDISNCNVTYNTLSNVNMKIKDKYLLKENDIILSTRISTKSCHVGYVSSNTPAIPKKNFIILRNCNDTYLPEFIANYLEYIGINKYLKENNKDTLTIEDIKLITIPKVDIDKQRDIINLVSPINKRITLYNKLINNDIELTKRLLSEVSNGN